MKKFCLLLLTSLLIAGIPRIIVNADTLEPTKEFYVNDYADVISAEVEDEIINLGYQLEEQTGAQIVLVTIDFTNGDSLETYAMDLFNDWGIGSAEKNDGLLILLSIGDDDYWVTQGEGLEATLPSGKISSILQKYLEPDFAAKDYSAGAKKTYEAFAKRLNSQRGNTKTGSESDVIKKADKYTYDHAKIISIEDEEYINQKSTEMKEKYNAGFYVVTRDYCEDGLSFQEDAISTFERLKAKGRDVVLVLYKEDDNYWLLPGRETEVFVTSKVLGNILDNVLEPEFVEKHYSQGAVDTADSIYKLFQSNYEDLTKIEPEVVNAGSDNDIKANAAGERVNESNGNEIGPDDGRYNVVVYAIGLGLLFIFILSIRSKRRRRYINDYGVPFNPYSRKYVRIYGPGGYWGAYGYPHGGYQNGGYHNNRYRNSGRRYNSDDDDGDRVRGRSSTGGSFWGSSGGAGRSSSSSASSSSSSYSGGGAGRSSGGGSSSSGHSSGGGRASSSGGGGRSRGGGAGRNS